MPAPHGTDAAPLRPNSTPTPGESSPVPTEEPATAPAPEENVTPTPSEPTSGGGASGLCANPYFPVKLGTRWVYNFSSGGGAENEITAVRADGFTVTLKQGNLIRPLEWTCRPEGLVALSYDGGPAAEVISTRGGKRLQFITTNVTSVSLPANLVPGMTWTQTYDVTMNAPGVSRSVSGKISITYSAVAIESVTVPAGTFQALKVEVQGTVEAPPGVFGSGRSVVRSAGTYWLARGVGTIKGTNEQYSVVTELAAYAPPAP